MYNITKGCLEWCNKDECIRTKTLNEMDLRNQQAMQFADDLKAKRSSMYSNYGKLSCTNKMVLSRKMYKKLIFNITNYKNYLIVTKMHPNGNFIFFILNLSALLLLLIKLKFFKLIGRLFNS